MRYLSLAEALVIAEAVTGIDRLVLAKAADCQICGRPNQYRGPDKSGAERPVGATPVRRVGWSRF